MSLKLYLAVAKGLKGEPLDRIIKATNFDDAFCCFTNSLSYIDMDDPGRSTHCTVYELSLAPAGVVDLSILRYRTFV